MSGFKSNNRKAPIHKSDGKMKRRKSSKNKNSHKNERIPYMDIAKQVASDVNWLRQFINTEINYLDNTLSGANISTTTAFQLLNGLSLGDAATNRTGQSIRMQGVDIRFTLSCYVNSLNFIRILVVYDKQCNGAIFGATGLLNAATPVSDYTVGGQMRFLVLYDQTFALSYLAGPANCCQVVKVNANQHTEYNTGNAGDITDINSGSLYLMYLSDQAINFPLISSYTRLWFVDN